MHTFSIHSRYTDYTYKINIYCPALSSPAQDLPVLYVLDGLYYFPLLQNAIQLQSRNAPKTDVQEAIVVGIYHDKDDIHERRFYDFTAPAKSYAYPPRMEHRTFRKVGGAENFHLFLEEELKPQIQNRFHVNQQQQSIFGHSLSGYFVLWHLLKHGNFQHSIAISPSIWWNNYELLAMKLALQEAKPSLFLSVGEKEGFMVEDSQRFFTQIPTDSLNCTFYIANDENHASIVPTVMSKALRFIFIQQIFSCTESKAAGTEDSY